MDDIKDFRSISDRIMKDIVMTPELKEKTLKRCKRKSYKTVIGVLAPAACVVLLIATMAAMGRFPWSSSTVPERSSEVSFVMEAAPGEEKQPQVNAGDVLKSAQAGEQVRYESAEEARKAFGDNLLISGYTPEGFVLNSIAGVETDQKADRVVFKYSSGNASFLVTEEKIKTRNDYPGFKTVDINGIPGYIKAEKIKTEGPTEQQRTELHWFRNECHYSITGQISEEAAVNLAKSMR
ncbi:DUF4367 domain-containing protein [Ruminiclostridium cellobioparum]|uniref:DUF4367 domain-containing protein n=1 Tax=Ruminiclostridium cellobioparum TaxID=29355 RepID=UPI00034B88F0|nr:DUF4367 domain-containing protein [Ruminiclostridium cellobioparum]